MKILVTGATGLIGKQLCSELIKQDHQLVVVSTRDEPRFRLDFTYPCEYLPWSRVNDLPRVDAVIHLAGDNISEGRWSERKKNSILSSRIDTTQALIESFEKNNRWPKTFISTSAIGIYGDRGDEFLTEESSAGLGFLADVCKSWEKVTAPLAAHSRLAILRLGVVLDAKGGFLAKMEPIFSNGAGGRVGSGQQWLSWIHSQDLIEMFLYALKTECVSGVYNAVAPEPVRNNHWAKAYAKQLDVPCIFPVPALALKAGLGEMAQIALASQNVVSAKIVQSGFQFRFSTLEDALKDLYSWKKSPGQRLFTSEQWLSQTREEVFPFFAKADNLERITPPFLNFKILKSSTPEIETGTLIDYRLKIHGVPIVWRTRIENWAPHQSFVDNQLKGPYKLWHHTHSFVPVPNGTLMQDHVIYELPMGWLGRIVAGSFVLKDVQAIFKYRTQVIQQLDGKL
jgi:uncharacterized protein (TIGR01777 family)